MCMSSWVGIRRSRARLVILCRAFCVALCPTVAWCSRRCGFLRQSQPRLVCAIGNAARLKSVEKYVAIRFLSSSERINKEYFCVFAFGVFWSVYAVVYIQWI